MRHTLTITEDTVDVARIRAAGGDEHEVRADAWVWEITCPYLPGDRYRPCQVWRECCHLSAAERDALDEAGDGPCPVSPAGRHEFIGGDVDVAYLTDECYLRVGEDVADQINELLLPKLAPGAHHVELGWDAYGDLMVVPGSGERVPS